MEFKLFSDIIDAFEKVVTQISNLKNIERNQRDRFREVIDDTCAMLDAALLLVFSRLGDILMLNDIGEFTKELQALDNFQDWLKLERDVRLCKNLRVAGREMNDLLSKIRNEIMLQDSAQFMQFISDIESGERELAEYISRALTQLAQLGQEVARSPMSLDNAKRTLRGVKTSLHKERQKLINIQIELVDKII